VAAARRFMRCCCGTRSLHPSTHFRTSYPRRRDARAGSHAWRKRAERIGSAVGGGRADRWSDERCQTGTIFRMCRLLNSLQV